MCLALQALKGQVQDFYMEQDDCSLLVSHLPCNLLAIQYSFSLKELLVNIPLLNILVEGLVHSLIGPTHLGVCLLSLDIYSQERASTHNHLYDQQNHYSLVEIT